MFRGMVWGAHERRATSLRLTRFAWLGNKWVVLVVTLSSRTVGLLFGQDTLTVPDMQTKYRYQLAGIGFGFLPCEWVRDDVARGSLVQKRVEEPKPDETLFMAWRTGDDGAALAWWRDQVRTAGTFQRISGIPWA